MFRFLKYFSIVEKCSVSHYTGLIRLCVIFGIYSSSKKALICLNRSQVERCCMMDFRFCVICSFVLVYKQRSVLPMYVYTIISRASKLTDNRALISFRCFIFAWYTNTLLLIVSSQLIMNRHFNVRRGDILCINKRVNKFGEILTRSWILNMFSTILK
jgi:hypothetical protein